MKLIRKILFPVVPIYYSVTWLRNKLFDLGIKKSVSYNFPIICIGNLSTGGTGKTPMVEYLIRLLKAEYKVATLSRGYKRKSKGFQLGNENSTVEILGDEPFQFYTKFKGQVKIAVDTNRNSGIKKLIDLDKTLDVILLDDAFQHRKVKAGFNIMLTTYSNLYTRDIVLPTGNLREARFGAKRANVIVVTKCPVNITEVEKNKMVSEINPTSTQSVFFSSIQYADTVVNGTSSLVVSNLTKFSLITGIANPESLIHFLKSKNLNFEHLAFEDHYNFSEEDIKVFEKQELLITTEKDFVRLKQYGSLKDKLYYLPITISIDKVEVFNKIIKNFVSSY